MNLQNAKIFQIYLPLSTICSWIKLARLILRKHVFTGLDTDLQAYKASNFGYEPCHEKNYLLQKQSFKVQISCVVAPCFSLHRYSVTHSTSQVSSRLLCRTWLQTQKTHFLAIIGHYIMGSEEHSADKRCKLICASSCLHS